VTSKITNPTFISYDHFIEIAKLATGGCPRGWPRMMEVATAGVLNVNMISGIKTRRGFIKKSEQVEALLRLEERVRSGEYTAPKVKTDGEMALALAEVRDEAMTDDQVRERTKKLFSDMENFVKLAFTGAIRSVIVMGPPGCGKTFPIMRAVEPLRQTRTVKCVSGGTSAVGIYTALHQCKDNGIVIFDDADSIFDTTDSLNLLKAATSPRGKRWLSWLKQNSKLEEDGIDPEFEFKGSVVVITNADMQAIADGRSKRAAHIAANLDRFHKVDLQLTSKRAMRLRVEQMLDDGMLRGYFTQKGYTDEQHDTAVDEFKTFLEESEDKFKNGITLREMDKFADLWMAAPTLGLDWRDLAVTSLGG